MFPKDYTHFIRKINAVYDGDPNGNYVMAEDVNELQEAIENLELSLGITDSSSDSIQSRIKRLETYTPLKVPSAIFLMDSNLTENETNTIEKISTYDLVAFQNFSSINTNILNELNNRGVETFGEVDSLMPLKKIQEEIGQWKREGAKGILLRNFSNDTFTRKQENEILKSVAEQEMTTMISSSYWHQLFETEYDVIYNPDKEELLLKENDILIVDNYAFYQRQYYGQEMSNKMNEFLQFRINKKIRILGNGLVTNQDEYSYLQAYALLYSIDYLFNGYQGGVLLESVNDYFSWPTYVSQWETKTPYIFEEASYTYRNIKNGRILINKDMTVQVDGFRVESNNIKWNPDTIPGESLKDYSVDPEKLSTYDVDRIIKLINDSSTVKIDPGKIDNESSGLLPANIPANNMKTFVILAINKHNDADSTEENQILDAGIKNLNANKLFGDIPIENMLTNIIKTINKSPDIIKVKNAEIETLKSSTISTSIVNSDNATISALNVTKNITALDATFKNKVNVKDIEGQNAYFVNLKSDIFNVDRIKAKSIEADNMSSLILDTIEANIETGKFDKIVSKSLESTTIKTELITAMNSMVGQAVIDGALIQTASITDAQIVNLSASKLNAGQINTSVVTIQGPDGHLRIADDTIKIYDKEDSEGLRRLRVILGSTKEVTKDENYGLVVLGPDGSTRLYDNTGVYSAGIHNNAISNEKIEDDAIDNRVIKANSIFAKHINANAITSEKINAGAVTADKIAAKSITAGSAIIDTAAISSAQISELHGGKIIAGTITAKEIKAGSISADKLAVGYQINLIKNNYDSFEPFAIGTKLGTVLSGAEQSMVNSNSSFSGDKSYLLRGNNKSNKILLDDSNRNHSSHIWSKREYILSAYVSTDNTNATVKIGMKFDSTEIMSEPFSINSKEYKRIFFTVTAPEGNQKGSMILETLDTNINVWFDCLQIEEKQENQQEPGWWRSTDLTTIDGSMIKTGYVEANRIRIGNGTIFGNGDIIEITNQGIKSSGKDGSAMMNSKGIEIIGGAFSLTNEGKVIIDGKKGMEVTSEKNKVAISANDGITISKNIDNEKIFYTTPDGELFLKGRIEVTKSDTIYTKSEVDKSLSTIDKQIDNIHVNLSQKLTISVGVKWGYSSWNGKEQNSFYVFGHTVNKDTFKEEPADIDGYIKNWENSDVIQIPKQAVSIVSIPKPAHGYITWDNTKKELWVISLDSSEVWKKYNANLADDGKTFEFNESMYVLGELDV